MADKIKLLELRKKMNSKRPKFLRQNYHFRQKVHDDLWRAPKGGQSKMRQKKRSHRAAVRIGYRGPEEIRGLHRSGAEFVYVNTIADVDKVHPAHQIAILGANVGTKKRYDILKVAVQKKIPFANINVEKFIADFEAKLKIRKEAKAAKVGTKAEAKPETKVEAPKPAEKIEAPKPEVKPEAKKKPARKKEAKVA